MNKKRFCQTLFACMLLLATFLQAPPAFAESVYGIDGIAGQDTLIKANGLPPEKNTHLLIEKPNKQYHLLTAQADESGKLTARLPAEETTQSGLYRVTLKRPNEQTYASFVAFRIHPGAVDTATSSVQIDQTMGLATGTDPVTVTIALRDEYGNAIPDHEVRLFGLRKHDRIEGGSAITDANGNATIRIASSEPGITVLSAFDLTSSTLIQNDLVVAFAPPSKVPMIGGNLPLGKTLFAEVPGPETDNAGLVSALRIDAPDAIMANQVMTLTVTAVDNQNQTVPSYTGTIRFSTTDENARVPADYTFRPEDLGAHTFSAVMNFSTTGIQTITATDLNDLTVTGERTFTVTQGQSGAGQTPAAGAPDIETPVDGAYATTTQTISGTASPGTQVKLFDGTEELAERITDAEGRFSFTQQNLSEGSHQFSVAAFNVNGDEVGRSETVTIQIDQTAPEIQFAVLEPADHVQPGTPLTLTIEAEEGVSQAIMTMGVDVRQLTPDPEIPGKYTASFVAPQEAGTFPIDIILVDQLGNEGTYRGQVVLTTDSNAAGIAGARPAAPQNIVVLPDDGRVNFTWEPVAHAAPINHYRFFYGLSTQDLTSTVDTVGNHAAWYIPNLTNGIEYYFAVAAVDVAGNEGTRSDIVSAVPLELHPAAPLSETPTGPGLALLAAGTLLASLGYTRLRRS